MIPRLSGTRCAPSHGVKRRMNDLNPDLPQDQILLLLTIAQPYMSRGVWPNWHYVQSQLDVRNLDARKILDSLPRVGSTGNLGPSYGFTSAPGHHLRDEDNIKLTIAAALPIEELRPYFAEPFLRVLHHMISLRLGTVPSPTEVNRPQLNSVELTTAVTGLKPEFIASLPEILDAEPSTWGGSGGITHGGVWHREIAREVLKYRQATDLLDYVATVCEIVTGWSAQQHEFHQQAIGSPSPSGIELSPSIPVPLKTYVDVGLLEELEDLDKTCPWSLDKLLNLARELNSNHAADQPYACHMLLRAILDHIPPAFGYKSFTQMVNNHWWSATDSKYVKKLSETRNASDDVLHRQIRYSPSRIGMEDLPPRPYVNALLQELLTVLSTPVTTGP
jgi:hypothetical protein